MNPIMLATGYFVAGFSVAAMFCISRISELTQENESLKADVQFFAEEIDQLVCSECGYEYGDYDYRRKIDGKTVCDDCFEEHERQVELKEQP